MSINNFIPQIWSARLLAHMDNAHVYGSIVNRDYEGEISGYGDTVKINQIGDITVSDYTKNTDMTAAQDLDGTQQLLVIDQAKYFNFQIDDVDKAQQNPKLMDAAMQRAAYALAEVTDKFVAGLHTGVDAANVIGTDAAPVTVKTTAAYEQLVALNQKLDEANVPADGRFVVVPPAFYAQILLDSRFISAGTAQTDNVLSNGYVGMAAGFRIYKSNNVPNTKGSAYKIVAGHPMAISYAEQIVETEAYRPERRMADACKGLLVFGGKLVQPKALAVLTANIG